MVALADRYSQEADTEGKRTTRNFRRPQNAYPRKFLQPKNRGPARKNRILSQKYLDEESYLYYYGYRYLSPELGRWLSRDPIGEEGGENLYGFVQNDPEDRIDMVGLTWSVRLWGELYADVGCPANKKGKCPLESAVNIFWRPGDDPVCCRSVKFIQIAWRQHKRRNGDDDRACHVDAGTSTYPFYDHHKLVWTPTEPYAWMTDDPGGSWFWTKHLYQRFETCAVCAAGYEKGTVYGCVRWEHEFKRYPKKKWRARRRALLPSDVDDTGYQNLAHKGCNGPSLDAKVGWAVGFYPTATWDSIVPDL